MRSLPTFHTETTEMLNNVDLARRLWHGDAQGLFVDDWKKFCDWLKLELRSLAPSLRDWSMPYVYSDDESVVVNVEADAS